MGRFAVVLLLAASASLSACGKSEVSTALTWYTELAPAIAKARREHKPLFVYAGTEWDEASNMLEHVTFSDSDVSALLRRYFVLFRLDCTDDDAPETNRLSQRFKVRGTPALIVFGPSGRTELRRFDMFIPPQTLAPALRLALRPEALEEAIEAARVEQLRLAAEEARRNAEWAEYARRLEQERPVVTIPPE